MLRTLERFLVSSVFIFSGLFALAPNSASAGAFNPSDNPDVRRILADIHAHPDSLSLRTRLMSTYCRLGSVEGRRLAQRGYAELLKQHPDDLELILAYARLRLDQGFLKEAERFYKRAARRNSHSVEAQFGLAHLALHDYRRYLDQKRLHAAEACLDRVLRLDPNHRDALYSRAFTWIVEKDTLKANACADRLAAAHPDDPWAWLLKGSLARGKKRVDEARKDLDRALGLIMDPKERDAFESLQFVSERSEAKRETADATGRAWIEKDFWKRNDPTPATTPNERQLEHMMRIVYADLYYGVEEKHIRGWNTAPGEAIIRYGPPESRAVGIGSMGVAGFQPPAMSQIHRINGRDVEFMFEDRNLSGLWLQPFNGGNPTAMDVAMSHEESAYEYPAEERFQLLAQRAQFKGDGGKTRMELVYGALDSSGTGRPLERQVMLYDRSWDSLAYSSGWVEPAVTVRNRRKPGQNYAVDFVSLPVEASHDSIWIGSQVSDSLEKGYGSRFELVGVRRFPAASLSVSDILLLDRVGFDGNGGALSLAGGWGVPTPDRVYLAGENVPFYFEAYNLKGDDSGLVRYGIHITIEKAKPPNARMSRPALIDTKTPPRPQVVTQFEESDVPGDLKRMLDLEVGKLEPDLYRLNLTLEDRVGGGSASSSVTFRVVRRPS